MNNWWDDGRTSSRFEKFLAQWRKPNFNISDALQSHNYRNIPWDFFSEILGRHLRDKHPELVEPLKQMETARGASLTMTMNDEGDPESEGTQDAAWKGEEEEEDGTMPSSSSVGRNAVERPQSATEDADQSATGYFHDKHD